MVAVKLAVAVGIGAVVHVVVDPHRKAVRGVVVTVRRVVFVALEEDVEIPRLEVDAQGNVRQRSKQVGHRVAHVVVQIMGRRHAACLGRAGGKQAETEYEQHRGEYSPRGSYMAP